MKEGIFLFFLAVGKGKALIFLANLLELNAYSVHLLFLARSRILEFYKYPGPICLLNSSSLRCRSNQFVEITYVKKNQKPNDSEIESTSLPRIIVEEPVGWISPDASDSADGSQFD